MKVAPTIFAALLLASPLRAEITVQLLGVADEPAKQGIAELHVFGGQVVELDVAVEALLGSKVSLGASLLQIASGLAAPFGEKSVVEPIEFDKQTRRIVHVPIPLPEVERRSEFRVLFRTLVAGAEMEANAGAAKLFVYPKDQVKDLAASLARLEKDAGLSLSVFGESKRIRAFLAQSGISVADSGSELPESLSKSTLYIGEADAHTVATRHPSDSRIIFFSPDPTLLPGVYTTTYGSGSLTKVTLLLLDSLLMNPQSQRAFSDILLHSLNASAITSAHLP